MLQWLSTTWLWSVWLMQDFANIFVFLPRKLGPVPAFGGLAIILVMLALTFANRGGPVQRVLRSKSSVSDIRSATIIDFTYAGLLYYFKEVSQIPMSTTWVFLGLIAGREYAFAALERHRTMLETARITLTDIAKAYIGLVVSIDMARGLPAMVQDQPLWTGPKGMWFFIGANVLVVPVALFLWRHTRNHSILLVASLAAGAALFFASLPLGCAGVPGRRSSTPTQKEPEPSTWSTQSSAPLRRSCSRPSSSASPAAPPWARCSRAASATRSPASPASPTASPTGAARSAT